MSEIQPSDSVLLALVAAHDERAFAALFDRHSETVFRYAWSRTSNTADAQELLQETFITAWDRRSTIRLVGESILPWLLVTCRNHSSNQRRRNSFRTAVPLRESDRTTASFDDLWIRDAIGRLPEIDRRVCELCLIEGLSYREAANELGMTSAAVGKRLERARAHLRKVVLDSDG